MGAVVLTSEVEERLGRAVELTGRDRVDLVTEAVMALLDDIEDITAAEAELAEIEAGRSRPISLEEAKRDLGLAD